MKIKNHGIILTYFLAEMLLLNLAFFVVAILQPGGFHFTIGDGILLSLLNAVWAGVVLFNEANSYYAQYHIPQRLKYQAINTFIWLGIVFPLCLWFSYKLPAILSAGYEIKLLGTALTFFGLSFIFLHTHKEKLPFFQKPRRFPTLNSGSRGERKTIIELLQKEISISAMKWWAFLMIKLEATGSMCSEKSKIFPGFWLVSMWTRS